MLHFYRPRVAQELTRFCTRCSKHFEEGGGGGYIDAWRAMLENFDRVGEAFRHGVEARVDARDYDAAV